MEEQEKKQQAKDLAKKVHDGDAAGFKEEMTKAANSRLLDKIKERKKEIISELNGKNSKEIANKKDDEPEDKSDDKPEDKSDDKPEDNE